MALTHTHGKWAATLDQLSFVNVGLLLLNSLFFSKEAKV